MRKKIIKKARHSDVIKLYKKGVNSHKIAQLLDVPHQRVVDKLESKLRKTNKFNKVLDSS